MTIRSGKTSSIALAVVLFIVVINISYSLNYIPGNVANNTPINIKGAPEFCIPKRRFLFSPPQTMQCWGPGIKDESGNYYFLASASADLFLKLQGVKEVRVTGILNNNSREKADLGLDVIGTVNVKSVYILK